ncbi:MAG: Glutamate--tRNA ligase [Syntrophus sp. SKADARSKE-3]|nr:Glutamate--tRNA ligase [Syntrophus sp. SKADARSKE-3]
MTDSAPRVRFAPSPTGELHVGNARTALFNWLFARHHGGTLVLRIEDTDQVRTSKAFEDNLIADLTWLGINWDEGPGKGGSFGPYHQSDRLSIYGDMLERLIAAEKVYPCYCTEEELEVERSSLIARKMMPRYMGKCRSLSPEDRRKMEAEGRTHTWRFRVSPGLIAFKDLIRGPVRFEGNAIGDFIIVRANGIPAYNFACVVDDHLMEISHIIRGEDHLSNTALQILLYQALGFEAPRFAHHALILGKDRSKLSKRHGSVAVREFLSKGILPDVMLNYLALLGASLGEGKEVCTADEIIARFSLDRAGKSGAIFDEDKLRWLNALYIHHKDTPSLVADLEPFMKAAGYDPRQMDRERLNLIVAAVRENLLTLADIGQYLAIFDDDRYNLAADAEDILATPEAQEVLRAVDEVLNAEPLDEEGLYGKIIAFAKNKTGFKGKGIFMPIRAAVTGQLRGPELDKVFAILGPASLKKRLARVLAA